MNLELKLNYEANGQPKVLELTLDVSSEKESAYSLSTEVGQMLLNFRPKALEATLTEQFKPKEFDAGGSDFNAELRRKMDERKVFATRHKSHK